MRSSYELIDFIMKIADEKDIKQNELARMVGYPKSTMSRYVNHTRPFPVNDVGEFSRVLNVPVPILLGIQVNDNRFSNLEVTLKVLTDTGALKTKEDYEGKIRDMLISALDSDVLDILNNK